MEMEPVTRRWITFSLIASGVLYVVSATLAQEDAGSASFDGQGFLRYRLEQRTSLKNISFFYRTAKRNGLLLHTQEDSRYLTVEVRKGVLVVRAQFGQGGLYAETQRDDLADGEWHKVRIKFDAYLMLHVDNRLEKLLPLAVGQDMVFSGVLWIGGLHHFRTVNHTSQTSGHYFKGCMGLVQASQLHILELPSLAMSTWHQRIEEAQGVVRGCRMEFVRGGHHGQAISLLKGYAFVAFAAWQAHPSATFGMQFRTASENCILLYNVGHHQVGHFMILELSDGQLHLLVNNGNGLHELRGGAMLNDRMWHNLLIHIHQRSVEVKVDKKDPLTLGLDRMSVDQTFSFTEPLYVGGLPEARFAEANQRGVWSVVSSDGVSGVGLLGCVRDVRINGREENLQLPAEANSTVAGCKWTFPCLSSPCSGEEVCVDNINTFTCGCPRFMSDCGDNETNLEMTSAPATASIVSATTLAVPVHPMVRKETMVVMAMEGQQTKLPNVTLIVTASEPFNVSSGRLFGPGLGKNGTIIRVLVTQPPVYGVLMANADKVSLTNFDLRLLTSGGLVYLHNGAEETEDSFEVFLATEKYALLEGINIKIRVTQINDIPIQANNTVLTLAIGSQQLVTKSVLAYTDADSTFWDIFFTVDCSSPNGQLEHVNQPGIPLFRFRQSDINNNRVLFSHFGNKLATTIDICLNVSDGQSQPQPTRLKVVAFTGRIILAKDQGLHVRYKSVMLITPAHLTAVTSFDAQQPTPSITYHVVREPHTGYVALFIGKGKDFQRTDIFAQADVNASLVHLIHNSSVARTEDSLVVQLASGLFTPKKEYTIPISITLPEPNIFPQLVVVTQSIVVKEGGHISVTSEHIRVSLQPHIKEFGPLEAVLEGPFKFGVLNVTRNNRSQTGKVFRVDHLDQSLTYHHNGHESKFDNATFCVRATGMWPPEVKEPKTSCGHVLSIQVLPVNDEEPGFVENRHLVLPEGSCRHITAKHLLAVDEDTVASELTFTITKNATNGYVILLPNKSLAANVFTQQDVTDNRVMFQHVRGEALESSFSFMLSDGRFTLRHIFVVKAQPVQIYVDTAGQHPLEVSAMSGQPAGMATMSLEQLGLSTDDPDQNGNIVFDVLQPAQHGRLVNTATMRNIQTFSYQQVQGNLIHYMLSSLDTRSKSDQLRLRARLGRAIREDLFVNITIHRKPLVKIAVMKPVLTPHGKDVNITEQFLKITYSGHITDEQVFIVIADGPEYGRLQEWLRPAHNTLKRFSMAQLKEHKISYQPMTSDPTLDFVHFYVTNGYRNTSIYTLNISTYLDHLHVVSYGLNTTEGSSVGALLPSTLHVEAPPNHHVLLTITKAPSNGYLIYNNLNNFSVVSEFPYSDMVKGDILYVHDGTETTRDEFSFSVHTWPVHNTSVPTVWQVINSTFLIQIAPENDHKPWRVNLVRKVPVVQFGHIRLTPKQLLYTDHDLHFNSSLLKYTVKNGLEYGQLSLQSSPLQPVREFYQGDVDSGHLSYYNLGDGEDDYMEFHVEDEDPTSYAEGFMTFVVKPLSVEIDSQRLVLDEGGQVVVGKSSLKLSTNLDDLVKSSLLLRLMTFPKHGTMLLNEKPVQANDSIDWDQLQSSLLIYRHDDSDTVADTVRLEPTYYQMSFQVVDIQFEIRPIDDTFPEVVQLSPLRVDEGSDAELTREQLIATDGEAGDAELKFTLVHRPQHGRLLVNGHKIQAFTQENINQRQVAYSHHEGAGLVDQFVFDVTDGKNAIHNRTFQIVIVPAEIPLLTQPFTVYEGHRALLNTTIVHVNNSFMALQPVQFWLKIKPQHGSVYRGLDTVSNFSLQELQEGKVSYAHDDSETLYDHFVVVAYLADKHSVPREVKIMVHPVNDQRPRKNSTDKWLDVWIGEPQPVTRDTFEWVDEDTPPENITYEVRKGVASGHLAMRQRPEIAVEQFTQADINRGLLVFVGKAKEVSGMTIIYVVHDQSGTNSEYGLLRVAVKQLRLEVDANHGIWVLRNTPTPIPKANLSISTNDESAHQRPITFLVSNHRHVLRHGHLALHTNQHTAINRFTNAQLEQGAVLYVHTDNHSWAPRDRIRLTVTTPNAAALSGLNVSVHIIHTINTNSLLHANSPLTIKENEQAVLTANNLQAGNIRARIAHDFNKNLASVYVLYRVISGPSHGTLVDEGTSNSSIDAFTQTEIDKEHVVYVHDKSESLHDRILLKVSVVDRITNETLHNFDAQLSVLIEPVNDEPPKIDAELFTSATQALSTVLSGDILNVSDKDTDDNHLVFTIVKPPARGVFKLYNTTVTNFTLLDIRSGIVSFRAGDMPGKFSVRLDITDGVHSSTANLTINVLKQQLELIVDTLHLKQATTVAQLDEEIQLLTNSPREEVLFSIISQPQHGILKTSTRTNIEEFTLADLEEGIFYKQVVLSYSRDRFSLTVSNRLEQHQIVSVEVVVDADVKMPEAKKAFVSYKKMVIGADLLDASVLASKTNSNPTFTILDPPKHGVLVVYNSGGRHKKRAAETASRFTNEDVQNGSVSYELFDDAPAGVFTDGFDFELSAKSVQPGIARLEFSVEAPNITTATSTTSGASQPSVATTALSSSAHQQPVTTNTLRTIKPPIKDSSDDLWTQVIIPVAAAGLLLFLFIFVIIVKCHSSGEQHKNRLRKSSSSSSKFTAGYDVPRNNSPVMTNHGRAAHSLSTDGAAVNGRHCGAVPGTHHDRDAAQITSSTFEPPQTHRSSTLPRNWSSESKPVLLHSASEQNTAEVLQVRSRTPPPVMPGDFYVGSTLTTSHNKQHTPVHREVTYMTASTYQSSGHLPVQTSNPVIITPDSMPALDKTSLHSSISHVGRNGSTALRKQEFWI